MTICTSKSTMARNEFVNMPKNAPNSRQSSLSLHLSIVVGKESIDLYLLVTFDTLSCPCMARLSPFQTLAKTWAMTHKFIRFATSRR